MKAKANPPVAAEPQGHMQTQRRRKAILMCLQQEDFVSTLELSRRFRLSPVSIRKDLTFLEGRGFLKRVHGGAELAGEAVSLLDLSERYLVHRTAKQRIALAAASLLDRPGLCIYIDTGSTNYLLARAIPRDLPLTVVTNSLSTIAALEGRPACQVITLGGSVDYGRKVLLGLWADSQLERFHFDLLFAGADSVSAEGFGSDEIGQGDMLRRAVARAAAAYVLADSSKAGRQSRSLFAAPADIAGWITDARPPAPLAKALARRGGKIILAP